MQIVSALLVLPSYRIVNSKVIGPYANRILNKWVLVNIYLILVHKFMWTNNNMTIKLRFFYHDILSADLLITGKNICRCGWFKLVEFYLEYGGHGGHQSEFSLSKRIFSRHKLERNLKKKCWNYTWTCVWPAWPPGEDDTGAASDGVMW